MSVCLLVWSFALFGCLGDGLVEYSVGSLLACLFDRLFFCLCLLIVYVYCLIGWLID